MRIVLFFLCLFFTINIYADQCSSDLGVAKYSDNAQKCNRCYFGVNLDLGSSCKAQIGGIPFPQNTYNVVGLSYTYQQSTNSLTPGQFYYAMKYAYCNKKDSKFSNDDCKDTIKSQDIMIDSNNIADSLDKCLKYKSYIQSISDPYLKGRVCLVKMSQANAAAYTTIDSKATSYICAFNILDKENQPYTNITQFDSLGCQTYSQFDGPPPFLPGIIPYTSFSVPQVKSYQGLNTDTTFQAPVATIRQSQGSKVIQAISIPLDLTNDLNQGVVSNCISEQDQNTNCATLNSSEPNLLTVQQNSIVLGQYPRPAIEQKPIAGLSFFPCYHTYQNPNSYSNSTSNTSKVYQGVFVFAINRGPQETIGTIANDATGDGKIYLDTNYMPVLSDKTPAECNLCVNAATQLQSQWGDNIYQTLTANSLIQNSCNLDPDITITKLKLYDQTGNNEYYYPDSTCNIPPSTLVQAPLRVDMFDQDEQDQLNTCNSTEGINYGYTSDVAFLDKYLVKVMPVIPVLDKNGEASAQVLVQKPGTGCSSYTTDTNYGLPFISPNGLRDRTLCLKPATVDAVNTYPLCSDNGSSIEQAACHGLYQGSKVPSINTTSTITNQTTTTETTPDKICMMTGGTWDFISGRYQVSYTTNLNKDKKVIPRMSCTDLPGCISLGNAPIANIGNAIWNGNAKFNELVSGGCDEENGFYYRRIGLLDNTTDFYTIDTAVVTDTTNQSNLQIALDTIKTQIIADQQSINIPYLSEEYLKENNNTLYEAYVNNQNIFICPPKITPKGTCIGGIYAIDKDLLSQSSTIVNPNSRTDCVKKDDGKLVYGTPVVCSNS